MSESVVWRRERELGVEAKNLTLRRSLNHYLSADKRIAALLLLCEQNHVSENVTFELLYHHVMLANQLDLLDHR